MRFFRLLEVVAREWEWEWRTRGCETIRGRLYCEAPGFFFEEGLRRSDRVFFLLPRVYFRQGSVRGVAQLTILGLASIKACIQVSAAAAQ